MNHIMNGGALEERSDSFGADPVSDFLRMSHPHYIQFNASEVSDPSVLDEELSFYAL